MTELKSRESYGDATRVTLCRLRLSCGWWKGPHSKLENVWGSGIPEGSGRMSREPLSQPGPGECWGRGRLWAGHRSSSASDPPCSVPQRLADAAENFQKAHRWQDNIKVRTTVASPGPRTCPPPARVDMNAAEEEGGGCTHPLAGHQGVRGVKPGTFAQCSAGI